MAPAPTQNHRPKQSLPPPRHTLRTPRQPIQTPRHHTPPDGSIGGTAFLQHTNDTDKRLIAVTLGDATVVDIQPKRITLDAAGYQTTLKLQYPLWLKK